MAKPTALTELGGSKIVILADKTATTPAAKAPMAVRSAASGEATYPVAHQGMATHRDEDTFNQPGGFTDTTDGGPIVAIAGKAGTTANAIEAKASAVAGTEMGLIVRPIPSGTQSVAGTGTAGTPGSAVLAVQGVSSGTAIPVSGTVTVTPSGTQTVTGGGTAGTAASGVVTVQGIASMTAVKVDGSAVTQPVSGTVTANAGTGTLAVSAASLPLPSGASTAAKQAALGTAGTASADVLSVQGVASMTALKVDGSAVTQPVSGTVAVTSLASLATVAKQPALGTAGTASADVISVQGIASMTALQNDITKVGGTAVTLGQKAAEASIPVVLASGTSLGSTLAGAWDTATYAIVESMTTLATTAETTILAADAAAFLNVVDLMWTQSVSGASLTFRHGIAGSGGAIFLIVYVGGSAQLLGNAGFRLPSRAATIGKGVSVQSSSSTNVYIKISAYKSTV